MPIKEKYTITGVFIVASLTLLIGVVYLITTSTIVLLGLLGTYISIVISLLFVYLEKMNVLEEQSQITTDITMNPLIWEFYEKSIIHLQKVINYDDSVYKDLFMQTLNDFNMEISRIASGIFVFRAESWRRPWQQLLSQKDVLFYYSVALVKCEQYWQDKPGKASIELNKEMASRVDTKRIFIIRDAIWDNQNIKKWISDQQNSKITVAVVRKSEIPSEEDLFHDFGIYGNRAVGYQFLDEQCNTTRFELHFDRETYMKTLDMFRKLELYATEEATNEYLSLQKQK